MSPSERDRLNAALKEVVGYVKSKLPDCWRINMALDCDGCDIELFDPRGNLVHVEEYSCILADMCDTANEEEGQE